eukprot:2562134-Prymnesium_polylepis.1
MVVARDTSRSLAITEKATKDGTLLSTSHYSVLLKDNKIPSPTCAAPRSSTDAADGVTRSDKYPDGVAAADRAACCAACEGDASCIAWVHEPATTNGVNCWPVKQFSGTKSASGREFGCGAAHSAACDAFFSMPVFT